MLTLVFALACSNLHYVQPQAPKYMVERYRKACLLWEDTKGNVQRYLVSYMLVRGAGSTDAMHQLYNLFRRKLPSAM
jgi:hypothetical protein